MLLQLILCEKIRLEKKKEKLGRKVFIAYFQHKTLNTDKDSSSTRL